MGLSVVGRCMGLSGREVMGLSSREVYGAVW